ncbi:MAG: hypothetical protein RLZZ282_1718 [Verrucomicrobiota bacterium]
MAGPGIKPSGGIGRSDSPAELEAAGPGGEGIAGGLIISRAELDDVAAGELVVAERLGEPACRVVGDKVFQGI